MYTRTTGRIFNIIVEHYIEKVKGGRMDRCNVTICRWETMDVNDRGWFANHYPTNSHPVTASTRRRLVAVAAMAQLNRKQLASPSVNSAVRC